MNELRIYLSKFVAGKGYIYGKSIFSTEKTDAEDVTEEMMIAIADECEFQSELRVGEEYIMDVEIARDDGTILSVDQLCIGWA